VKNNSSNPVHPANPEILSSSVVPLTEAIMMRTQVKRGVMAALVSLAAAGAMQAQADTRPTLAVMNFQNGALGSAQTELAPLTVGIQDLLIYTLSGNDKLRVVERANLQQLMKEQDLGASGRVDAASAAKLGKILGAGHMIFGSFVTDTKGNMRIVAHSTNVETTLIEYNTSVEGKQADVMALITKLADQLNAGLKLPSLTTAMIDSTMKTAKKVPFQATLLYSRALAAKDAGNNAEAVQLLQKSLETFPDFAPAQQELKKLQPASGGE
jgi:TolB-like protein